MPSISIIIPAWNSATHLPRCLVCLSAQTYRDFEVIIIDNGSTDNAAVALEEKYPNLDLRVERLASNRGFAVANNIGASLAHGDWLALLNADAFPEPTWLENLLRAAKEYPDFSCFASRQIRANAPEFLDGAGDLYHISGMAWRRYLNYPANQYGLEATEVFSPCAAAALYARHAYLDVGGFDEDFFTYYEDVDLGFRLRLRGYRCLYVPQAVVYHIGSSTFGVASDFAFYYAHRNLVWSFIQNMPAQLLWWYLPAHLLANLIYVVTYTLRGRGGVLWRAKWDALRGLKHALQKRHEIQSRRLADSADLMRVMEHGLLKPYLLGYRLRRVNSASKKKR